MDTELAGKVAVITGASGGIGSAMARAFAEEGANLVLHCRANRKGAEELKRELDCVESVVVQADLTTEAGAKKLLAAAMKKFGRADVMVANAGLWATVDEPVHRMSLKRWRHTVDGVLTSAFLSMREFLRVVEKQRRGNAVLISSTAGIFGEAGHAEYASAKSAMAFGFTRTLKNEIARIAPHTKDYCGGRVNCVCPGWTVVPRTADKLGDTAMVKRVTATMALKQIARPEDIANATVFLASDKLARHITGQAIVVAGGMEGRMLWQSGEIDPRIA